MVKCSIKNSKLKGGNPYIGLFCREINTLRGHSDHVSSVAFHPTEPLLATGSWDKTARVWCMSADGIAHQSPVSTLSGHHNHVNSVAFQPSGHFLATGSSDNTVKLCHLRPDGSNPICIETLHGHNHSVQSEAFDPSGNLLATGSWDNTVKLWDCSKINDYLRRRALTHGSIAAKAIKGLTTGNQLQLDSVSQIRFSNHTQGRIGNPPKIEYYTPQNEQDRMK